MKDFSLEPGAPNLDAMAPDDLMTFWQATRAGRSQAKRMFPDRPRGYVRATRELGLYASNKATAMRCRESGNVARALEYEKIADRIYSNLPVWARW